MKILCAGIAVLDRIFTVDKLPAGEGKFFATDFKEQGGGPAATAAVACARLGLPVDMIARVGDDPTGKTILSELEDEHVGTGNMRVIAGALSTQAAITVDRQGSRIIVSYPSPSLIPSADFMQNIDFRQYNAVLCDVRWGQGALQAFRQAKEAGILRVLDADITDEPIDALVSLATHAVFSCPGLARFAGTEDRDKGLEYAAQHCGGEVIVTLGADGYAFLENGKIVRMPGFKVKAVDTTGAGDVFHGAFVSALTLGMSQREALRFAAATAAIKCTKSGGRSGIPDRKTVEGFLAVH